MIHVLLQSDELPEFYRAVRDRFMQGGSVGQALIALSLLAVLVLVVYILSKVERRVAVPAPTDDPEQLFHDVLPKLDLTTTQRQILGTISRDLRLAHPAVLLLSEALFERHVAEWKQKSRAGGADAAQDETLRKARLRLFPTGVGWVSSQTRRP